MGNRVGKLQSHTSNNISFCKISVKKGWTKGIVCNSRLLVPTFHPIDEVKIIADCLENQFRAHDLFDCDLRRHVEAQVKNPCCLPSMKIRLLISNSVISQKKYKLEIR
jgi:hypothetical protein